jgi:glyoxylase-like metal-dependent hydrolase (beta-lactamase superfamily II)
MVQADLGPDLNALVRRAFGPFKFDDVELRLPTDTFSGRLSLDAGGRTVEVIEVGPAHTEGDVVAHVPEAGTVFTGDILFVDATPIVWVSLSNWLAACDLVRDLGAETLVPGHGPVCGQAEADNLRAYLELMQAQSAERHDAGMDAFDAALDIDLGAFADWENPERIVVNVEAAYRELDPGREPPSPVDLFAGMARYVRAKGL